MRDRPGCQGCWYPERRKEMDAAVASETRITAATIPCSGAFTSGADAAQGSSSGGQICSYNCCGFAAPRVSHWEKMGDHFPDQLSGPLYCRGTKIEAENRSPTFRTLHIFFKYPFCRCDPKAAAFWRWSNYLQARSAPGRPLVVINIDETNVKLVPQERAGHVSKRAYRLFVRGRLMIRRWRRSQ